MDEGLDLAGLTFLWGKIKSLFASAGPPIGTVDMYAGGTAPDKWLLCQGQAVSREHYADLFNVIGTTYGTGDGSTTFNLPNFNDRMPIGAGSSYALNASGGSKDAIIPYHRHSVGTVGMDSKLGSHSHNVTICINNESGSASAPAWSLLLSSGTAPSGFYNNAGTAVSKKNARTWYSASQNMAHSHTVNSHNTNYAGSSGNTTNANLPPYRGINFMIYAGVSAPTS